MAKIWEPQPIQVYESWIEKCHNEDSISDMSSWELDFLDSISERLDRKVNLTERQAEILERIYTEKTK